MTLQLIVNTPKRGQRTYRKVQYQRSGARATKYAIKHVIIPAMEELDFVLCLIIFYAWYAVRFDGGGFI